MENSNNMEELIMELTPMMEKKLKKTFDLEIEMLQADIEALPDGRKKFTMQISKEKADVIQKFCIMVISDYNNICKN